MAINLEKLQKGFDDLLDDPNFPADFEKWLTEKRLANKKPEINPDIQYINSLTLDGKHELAAAFFASIRMRDYSKEHKKIMDFLKRERLRVFKETEEEHGYAGSEFLAAKHVLAIIYG